MRRRWPFRTVHLAIIVLVAAGGRLLVTDGERRPAGPAPRVLAAQTPPVAAPTEIPPDQTFTIAAAGDTAGAANAASDRSWWGPEAPNCTLNPTTATRGQSRPRSSGVSVCWQ